MDENPVVTGLLEYNKREDRVNKTYPLSSCAAAVQDFVSGNSAIVVLNC